ncbi:MAG: four helix bundle protein [Gemmatimonadetes bacterium]|nr:four helix bundle protein [Gemmatimonadota bacterium]
MRKYKHLRVYIEAERLSLDVAEVCNRLPRRRNGMVLDQAVAAANSVPANIAEGSKRETNRDYHVFLGYSSGSLAELDVHLVQLRTSYPAAKEFPKFLVRRAQVEQLLNGLITTVCRRMLTEPERYRKDQ